MSLDHLPHIRVTHVGGPLDGLCIPVLLMSKEDSMEIGKRTYLQLPRQAVIDCVDDPAAVPERYGAFAVVYVHASEERAEFDGFAFRAFPVLDQKYDDPACDWVMIDAAFKGLPSMSEPIFPPLPEDETEARLRRALLN